MSSKSKGDDKEGLAETILQRMGYRTQRAWRKMIRLAPNRFISQTNDFFTCFDIIGIGPDTNRFVQVCHYPDQAHKFRKIEEADIPANTVNFLEVWAWRGGGKKLDKRTKKRVWIPNQVFYIYRFSYNTHEWDLLYIIDKDGNKWNNYGE